MINDKDKPTSPLLKALKPVARQYITQENIERVFTAITHDCPCAEGEKPVLVVSRGRDDVIAAGVYTIDEKRRLTSMYQRMPVSELLINILK